MTEQELTIRCLEEDRDRLLELNSHLCAAWRSEIERRRRAEEELEQLSRRQRNGEAVFRGEIT